MIQSMKSNNPFDILSDLKLTYTGEDSLSKTDNEDIVDSHHYRKNQKIRVWLQKKKRNGKPVSVITGFDEYREDIKELARLLKVKLGVGGSNTDDEIVIQGQNRDKIIEILKSQGFKDVKKSGG